MPILYLREKIGRGWLLADHISKGIYMGRIACKMQEQMRVSYIFELVMVFRSSLKASADTSC